VGVDALAERQYARHIIEWHWLSPNPIEGLAQQRIGLGQPRAQGLDLVGGFVQGHCGPWHFVPA
jgi:hypothetical protein